MKEERRPKKHGLVFALCRSFSICFPPPFMLFVSNIHYSKLQKGKKFFFSGGVNPMKPFFFLYVLHIYAVGKWIFGDSHHIRFNQLYSGGSLRIEKRQLCIYYHCSSFIGSSGEAHHPYTESGFKPYSTMDGNHAAVPKVWKKMIYRLTNPSSHIKPASYCLT